MKPPRNKDGAIVIPLPRVRVEGQGPFCITRNPLGRHCTHASALIETGLRRLYCKNCGAQLDPFDKLASLVAAGDALLHAEHARSLIRLELKELKTEAARLKANVRTLRSRRGICVKCGKDVKPQEHCEDCTDRFQTIAVWRAELPAEKRATKRGKRGA